MFDEDYDGPFSVYVSVCGTCTSCRENFTLFDDDDIVLVDDCDSRGPNETYFREVYADAIELAYMMDELNNITNLTMLHELRFEPCAEETSTFDTTIGMYLVCFMI